MTDLEKKDQEIWALKSTLEWCKEIVANHQDCDKRLRFNRVMYFIAGTLFMALIFSLSGCSWQGQRHQVVDPNGMITTNSEWWSMRCLWMSNGVECYTKTPYYTSGASVDNSASDANSVGAVAEGVVSGIAGIK